MIEALYGNIAVGRVILLCREGWQLGALLREEQPQSLLWRRTSPLLKTEPKPGWSVPTATVLELPLGRPKRGYAGGNIAVEP
jgi:hypothetical protein